MPLPVRLPVQPPAANERIAERYIGRSNWKLGVSILASVPHANVQPVGEFSSVAVGLARIESIRYSGQSANGHVVEH
jgi:hypothetical protein